MNIDLADLRIGDIEESEDGVRLTMRINEFLWESILHTIETWITGFEHKIDNWEDREEQPSDTYVITIGGEERIVVELMGSEEEGLMFTVSDDDYITTIPWESHEELATEILAMMEVSAKSEPVSEYYLSSKKCSETMNLHGLCTIFRHTNTCAYCDLTVNGVIENEIGITGPDIREDEEPPGGVDGRTRDNGY